MATDRSHYEVLGVARDASPDEIRRSYRALARRLHPDALANETSETSSSLSGSSSRSGRGVDRAVTMADVNHAWDVLSDPLRRREYDASLNAGTTYGRSHNDAPRSNPESGAESVVFGRREILFDGPRFPWRAMLILAAVGSIAVLTAHASTTPDVPFAPDQLLQAGSCVEFDQNNDAVEVLCTGPHDGVVRQFVPIDHSCPMDTEAHRDRQGMGKACVDIVAENPD